MLSVFLDVVTWVFLLGGSFFAVVGGVGIVRLPNFYTRLHGGGVTDTMGAGLILLGLTFQAEPLVTLKLFMILAFLLITSPTACHALAHASLDQERTESSEAPEKG